jgi:hypothetical protein
MPQYNNIVASAAGSNASSSLTLSSSTADYGVSTLIGSSSTAGVNNASIGNQTLNIGSLGGATVIPRIRISFNDASWAGQTIQIDLWTSLPTFTNGDRGAWALATGSGSHLASYQGVLSAAAGDGVYAECDVTTKAYPTVKVAGVQTIYWTAQAITGVASTAANGILTVIAEEAN